MYGKSYYFPSGIVNALNNYSCRLYNKYLNAGCFDLQWACNKAFTVLFALS